MNISDLIRELEKQRNQIDEAIRALREVFSTNGIPKHRIVQASIDGAQPKAPKKTKRYISPEGRARIAAAQKARWRRVKRQAGSKA